MLAAYCIQIALSLSLSLSPSLSVRVRRALLRIRDSEEIASYEKRVYAETLRRINRAYANFTYRRASPRAITRKVIQSCRNRGACLAALSGIS